MANENRFSATGRRKEASARVWVQPGSGAVTVNNRAIEVYFKREVLRMILAQPLEATEKLGKLRPRSIGQASRIPGITPAAVSILLVMARSKPAA